MSEKYTLELYEKLYFHELNSKENFSPRLQLTSAMLIAIIGISASILNQITKIDCSFINIVAINSYLLSIPLLSLSIFNFCKAFNGNSYEALPTADKLQELKISLDEYNKQHNIPLDQQETIQKRIMELFISCSSANFHMNKSRAERLSNSNKYLILSAAPLIATYLLININ